MTTQADRLPFRSQGEIVDSLRRQGLYHLTFEAMRETHRTIAELYIRNTAAPRSCRSLWRVGLETGSLLAGAAALESLRETADA